MLCKAREGWQCIGMMFVVLFMRTFVICNVGNFFFQSQGGRGSFLVFQFLEGVSNVRDEVIVLFIRTLSFVM